MDTIANFLTSVLNAQRVEKKHLVVPYSRLSLALAQVLQAKGFIAKVREEKETTERPMIKITLAYDDGTSRLHGLRRLSKPGQRRYVTKDKIPYSYDGLGMIILSTPQGLMDGTTARKQGIGGELLCEVW